MRSPLVILFYPLPSPPLQLSLLPGSIRLHTLPTAGSFPSICGSTGLPKAELQGRRWISLPSRGDGPSLPSPLLSDDGGGAPRPTARPERRRHPSSPPVPAGVSPPSSPASTADLPCVPRAMVMGERGAPTESPSAGELPPASLPSSAQAAVQR
jgi:hypothetical protein